MERVPLTEETEAIPSVHLAQPAAGEATSVQHFRIEPEATVPEHDHHHEQTGFVYEGELTFIVGDESGERSREIRVGPGDSFTIPGGEPHAAENRGDVAARGVDSPPRPDPLWAD